MADVLTITAADRLTLGRDSGHKNQLGVPRHLGTGNNSCHSGEAWPHVEERTVDVGFIGSE
jgi:hypothetical protein